MWGTVLSLGPKILGIAKGNPMIIGAVLAIAFSGWIGYKVAQAKYESEKVEALENLIIQQQLISEENMEINEDVVEVVEVIRWKERVVLEQVDNYVEENSSALDCELDADGLQLWNSAGQE